MTPAPRRPSLWLTTLRADGSPHTTPVWFVSVDDELWIASASRNVKVRNVRRDDRVAVAFDGTSAAPQVAEGRVEVHDPIDPVLHAPVLAAFSARYDGWDAADAAHDGPRVLLQLRVERWLLRSDDGG